ncbi:MAG: gluconate 2-dehydrogenase subunit 3 family protein [Gemmatimonadaceae bacterium]
MAERNDMKEMTRREAVQLLGVLPFAAALTWTTPEQERVRQLVAAALRDAGQGTAFVPRFFSPAEFRTARLLADMIIPADDRSGNASDAGVPEFMDFVLVEYPDMQKWMRPGLAWIDAESQRRHGKNFADASVTEREAILNDVAWPDRAPATLTAGVDFFNRFRDLTSSGFWSSRMGVKDLEYQGNTFVPEWNGCPPAALSKLGVSYDKFDPKSQRLTPPREQL